MSGASSPLLIKALALLAAPAVMAQTYTETYAYTTVTVPGGTSALVAGTLKNTAELITEAVVNADFGSGQQTVTVSGANWSAGQWTAETHVCYITNTDDAEESFLITGHTADTLTISTSFNLQDPARSIPDAPSTTAITIRKAATVGQLLGVGAETNFTTADKVSLWNGGGFTDYTLNGSGNWQRTGVFGTVNDDVIFPDEGFFVIRNDASDLELVFFGTVPGKAQVTTIPAPGAQYVSSRYPADTTIGQMGFETLPNWQKGAGGDKVYMWTGSGWNAYYYDTTDVWRREGWFSPVPDDPVPANSVLWVVRLGSSSAADSSNVHVLPYTP